MTRYFQPEARVYFWNVQGRYEVDFIVEAGNKCIAIEVKGSARWEDRDLAGFRAFLSTTPHYIAGVLAYNGKAAVKLGERLWAIPLSIIFS